jgi:hypothetical protein
MSAVYYSFFDLDRLLFDRVVLVGTTYNFSPAHRSVTTDIVPHVIGDVAPLVWVFHEVDTPEFADADGTYPVATIKAVVLYNSVALKPLLYLDHESFAPLPVASLGGPVDLTLNIGTLVNVA